MEAIYSGINFAKELKKKTLYTLDPLNQRVYDNEVLKYPFLAVNIGSGVSIIRFAAPTGQFERVGGTSLGGSTFLGLCRKLVGVDDFEKLIEMAERCSNTEGIDLLFKDYFADAKVNKEKEMYVCISLANIARMSPEDVSKINKDELARSLLQLIAFNIAQVAFLYARLYGVTRCLFTGNFIRNKAIIQVFIQEAFNYFLETTSFDCKVKSTQTVLV